MGARRKWLPYAVACGLFLLLGFVLFNSTGRDDAYISFWPARTLARLGQILNYNGERVEQSSSFLFVVVLAALCKLSAQEPILMGYVLSIGLGAAVVAGVTAMAGGRAGVLAALAVPLMYWSFSGMETSLVAALALLLVWVCRQYAEGTMHIFPAIVAMKLWLLARPEAPFTLLLALGLAALLLPGRRKRILVLAAWAILLALAIASYRYWQFGTALPQPAVAKGGFRPGNGLAYVVKNWPVVLFMLAFIPALKRGPLERWCVALGSSVLVFIVLSGGDWMEGGRFFATIVPLALVCLAPHLAIRPVIWRVAAPLSLAWVVWFAGSESRGTPIWSVEKVDGFGYFEYASRVHKRDMNAVRRLLAQLDAFGGRPITLYSEQMGMVSYHAALRHFGRVHFYDRWALVEPAFTRCALTKDSPKSEIGLVTPYEAPLHGIPACGIPAPDILYDIDGKVMKQAMDAGFEVVWKEGGVLPQPPILRGHRMQSFQFIALPAQK